MLGKTLRVASIALLALAAVVAVLYVTNAPPATPPISLAEAANPTKPYVIKLHAQWCPVCMLTKDEWAEIEEAYAGRVNLVVFDSTNDAAVERSKAEAERLGLGEFLRGYSGATGMVVVLDGRTKNVTAELAGIHPFDGYRAAIDAVLNNVE
jgi:thiol-disulfide isomerase/thioredoxin